MAKASTQSVASHRFKPKKRRPGIHAKSKTAVGKKSKNFVKLYKGQGH